MIIVSLGVGEAMTRASAKNASGGTRRHKPAACRGNGLRFAARVAVAVELLLPRCCAGLVEQGGGCRIRAR
ncbi:MAG: hypothetical protein J2P47_05160 [Acetobacteraceae bacterium]|nr:hypothetical protein [Acetobacteraceae bacterium]